MPIELSDRTKSELIYSIKRYFLEEREEEIGDLKASFFLDFVLEEIGPSIYNQAVKDAQARLQGAVDELDVTLQEAEFRYSGKRGGLRKH